MSASSDPGKECLEDPKTPEDIEAMEAEFHTQNPLWKDLMRNMKCHIDHFILMILDKTGYKTYHTLKKITKDTITTMEEFVRGDGILSRVKKEDLHLYLGPVLEREKFCFMPGEKDLILSIAAFVTKNHKEPDVPALGKAVNLFPIFKKRNGNLSASGDTVSEEPASKKKKSADCTVVTFDVPKEVKKIRKLLNDKLLKKKLPDAIVKSVSSMQIEVKTIVLKGSDNQQTSTLSGKILCPCCKKFLAVPYTLPGYWNTSNVHRHLSGHIDNGEFSNSTLRCFVRSNDLEEDIDDDLLESGQEPDINKDKDNDLPLKVSISEDGTRVQERFSYDPFTNSIIGPVLPLADSGVPLTNSYPATSAAMIANHLKNGKVASTGYAIMAQPLKDGSPPFCLNLFGTDNKFYSDQVYKRWAFIFEQLKKIGIEAVCFSSDGDQKLLSAMHSLLFNKQFGVYKQEWAEWFYASARQDYVVMQDAVHTVNKFRTRLSPPHVLFIGKYVASQTHIRSLITNVARGEHGLTNHDLDKEDKMNFDASKKICSERVTDLLKDKVAGSKGTVLYLTSMRYLMEGCLNTSLSPSEKNYKVWYCCFFLRLWKRWLLYHPTYKTENFVTSNLFVCVEIIAHALIKLVVKFRDNDLPIYFLTHLYSSQPCETFFRLARSMTTTESTVINFSIKEFLARVRRIDMLQYCTCKLGDKLEFPKEKRKKLLGILTKEKLEASYLPTDCDIQTIVKAAKTEVLTNLNECGIQLSESSSLIKIQSYLVSITNFEDGNENRADEAVSYQADITEDDIPLDIMASFPSPSPHSLEPLRDAVNNTLPPHSIFVMVPNSNGGFSRMKKSTLCWLLVNSGIKLSTKRLDRVREMVSFSMSNMLLHSSLSLQEPSKKKEVSAGEWCIFKNPVKRTPYYFIVQVLGFTYLTAGPGQSRSYTLRTAPIKPPTSTECRGIGCLCDRFRAKEDARLLEFNAKVQSYINISQYVVTIPHPTIRDSNLCTTMAVVQFLKNLV
ncbi:hypothetical protein FOCC_FOCC016691 [Frankliniella occidentalis]|nr:hypothetical protein FOCC_FOCC016691 [Frankliniella occidentalis]